jgi:Domain of unknown function (DUF4136)
MNTIDSRRTRRALVRTLCVAAVLSGAAACYGGYRYGNSGGVLGVGTYYGPYWYPDNYYTYSYVRYPWWGDPPPPPANDPMVENNATHRAIVEQVHQSFGGRGYKTAEQGDVDVAVYASNRPGELDISGYTHDYEWKNLPKLRETTKYPRGTVVVDVLQPKTHVLLWRGTTKAEISDDSEKYQADLRSAVERVVEKYPKSKH